MKSTFDERLRTMPLKELVRAYSQLVCLPTQSFARYWLSDTRARISNEVSRRIAAGERRIEDAR